MSCAVVILVGGGGETRSSSLASVSALPPAGLRAHSVSRMKRKSKQKS